MAVGFAASGQTNLTRRLRKGGQGFPDVSRQILLGIHDRTAAFAEEVSDMLKIMGNGAKLGMEFGAFSEPAIACLLAICLLFNFSSIFIDISSALT